MRALCSVMPLDSQAVDAQGWAALAKRLHEEGAMLLTLWGSDERAEHGGFTMYACWIGADGLTLARLDLADGVTHYPGLHELFPVADRLQRGVADLLGLQALGMDARPWLRHAAWPADVFPLRRDVPCAQGCAEPAFAPYPFVAVDGEGVHEIAVGPVHAGVIEPGQFRFSVVGEKVLRLEERLGFTHKGVEKRFEALSLRDGVRLAARLSGDSAVANAWAYCMALEALAGVQPPPRARYWRAVLLERERVANHLGDLGAIANDAGFGFALAQFARLKEGVVRLNARAFGARYPMDAVQPGGVAVDPDDVLKQELRRQGEQLRAEIAALKSILDEHEGLQDRFRTTGTVPIERARSLGMLGLAARASGLAMDLRTLPGFAPYDRVKVQAARELAGDVAARVAVRFAECIEALRLCEQLLDTMPEGDVLAPLPDEVAPGLAIGLVEGWRGPALIALHAGPKQRILRCHAHDPSWQNWPALEWAILKDIVADFPLINKSFNLSYSGHDG